MTRTMCAFDNARTYVCMHARKRVRMCVYVRLLLDVYVMILLLNLRKGWSCSRNYCKETVLLYLIKETDIYIYNTHTHARTHARTHTHTHTHTQILEQIQTN